MIDSRRFGYYNEFVVMGRRVDFKLARGTARSLIRSLSALGDLKEGPLAAPLNTIMQEYFDGGIPAGRLVTRGFELRDQLAGAGPCPTSCEIIRHPVRKRVLVEHVRPGVIEGKEQPWIVCASSVFDLGRDELVLVEVVGHIAISMHALVRLLERSQFQGANLTGLMDAATLWAVPLLQVMGCAG
jgi:hypothetical protein